MALETAMLPTPAKLLDRIQKLLAY
jgi:hypothetical protein